MGVVSQISKMMMRRESTLTVTRSLAASLTKWPSGSEKASTLSCSLEQELVLGKQQSETRHLQTINYILLSSLLSLPSSISSCGIPDFRSGMKTVLSTGPGVWELMANDASRPQGTTIKPILQALPSPTHMAMVKLHEEGVVKFTISQNVDGLHRRSGLSPAELAELHGNTNLETCQQCGRQYFRDFETRYRRIDSLPCTEAYHKVYLTNAS